MLPASLTAFSDKNRTRNRIAKHLTTKPSQRLSRASFVSFRQPPAPGATLRLGICVNLYESFALQARSWPSICLRGRLAKRRLVGRIHVKAGLARGAVSGRRRVAHGLTRSCPDVFDGVSAADLANETMLVFLNSSTALGWKPDKGDLSAFLCGVLRHKFLEAPANAA